MASTYSLPQKPGNISAVFQSGGASQLLIRSGELHGLRFSKVISYGNALDLDESDFLDYLAEDEETNIIAAYFEGTKDGQKFLKALTNAAQAKPVIAIKGGRSSAGAKAAASHTAAIAGSEVVWRAALKKTGITVVSNLNEMIAHLVAFSLMPRIRGNKVGIMTIAGGGLCVMAADICESAGLNIPPLPNDIRNVLKVRAPGIWDWIGNPVDASLIVAGASSVFFDLAKEMARILSESPAFDFVLVELTDDNPFPNEVWSEIARTQTEAIIALHKKNLKPLAVVVSGGTFGTHFSQYERWDALGAQRARLVEAGVPTFSSMAEAALAIRHYVDYCSLSATT
jgi:acyl-CoA synthetase (NDP forming)